MLNLLVGNDVFCSQLVGHAVIVWLCLSVEDDESLTGRFGNRSRKRFVMLTRPAQLQTAPLVKCYFHVKNPMRLTLWMVDWLTLGILW